MRFHFTLAICERFCPSSRCKPHSSIIFSRPPRTRACRLYSLLPTYVLFSTFAFCNLRTSFLLGPSLLTLRYSLHAPTSPFFLGHTQSFTTSTPISQSYTNTPDIGLDVLKMGIVRLTQYLRLTQQLIYSHRHETAPNFLHIRQPLCKPVHSLVMRWRKLYSVKRSGWKEVIPLLTVALSVCRPYTSLIVHLTNHIL